MLALIFGIIISLCQAFAPSLTLKGFESRARWKCKPCYHRGTVLRADRDGRENSDQKETLADGLLEDRKAGYESEKRGGREEQRKPESFDILTVSLPGYRTVTDLSALCILLENCREIDVLPAMYFLGLRSCASCPRLILCIRGEMMLL